MNTKRKYPSITILFWLEEGLLGRQRAGATHVDRHRVAPQVGHGYHPVVKKDVALPVEGLTTLQNALRPCKIWRVPEALSALGHPI